MKLNRVVITGIGALSPIGNDASTYWKGLISGQSGAGPITHFDASNFKTQFACELKNLDLQHYFHRKELRKYDYYTAYALIAADEAIKDSMLNLDEIDKRFAGVIWGSGIGGIKTFSDEIEGFINKFKCNKELKAVCGSRILRLGSSIRRSVFRHYFGRILRL